MKTKDLKDKIKSEFLYDSPETLKNIKEQCKYISQTEVPFTLNKKTKLTLKKILLCASWIIVLFIGILLGSINNQSVKSSKLLSIYVDVNPSIEIQIDENYNVYKLIPINDDANIVINNLNLNGTNINTAINAIVSSIYANGYLTPSTNSVLVSIDNEDDKYLNLLTKLTNDINDLFKNNNEMNCSVIGQKFHKDDELKDRADEHHISMGKMHLIDKILKENEFYQDIEELSKMSIQELNLIYSTNHKPNNNHQDDIMMGKPGGFLEDNVAYQMLLEYLELTEEDIEWFDIKAVPHHDHKEDRKMIYMVTIIKNGDDKRLRYLVDCVTGEVLEDDMEKEFDKPKK